MNTLARSFQDVKVFAGDKFGPAADANYKNLNWATGKQTTQNLLTRFDFDDNQDKVRVHHPPPTVSGQKYFLFLLWKLSNQSKIISK